MTPTREEIEAARQTAVTVDEYVASMSKLYRWKFLERRKSYQPGQEALASLQSLARDYFVLAFSAQWCEDCSKHIPVLGLLAEAAGLEVKVLGGIKKRLSKESLWAVPPSPPEVLSFGVEKLPWIILYDRAGNERGRIVEGPRHTGTIEEELLWFMRRQDQPG